MSASNTSRFDELVSRHLDEGLTDTETAELIGLLEGPLLAGRFLEMMRLNSEIAGLLSAPVPDDAMVELVRGDIERALVGSEPSNSAPLRIDAPARSLQEIPPTFIPLPRPRSAWRLSGRRVLACAALLLVLAGLSILFLNRSGIPKEPSVTSLQGDVRLVGPAGEQPIAPGHSWRRGETLKTVGSKSTATIILNDGSRLVLSENCRALNQSTKTETRIELEHGALQANVAKQPAKGQFLFVTPEAEAVIVGTTLRLATGAHHTRLEVTEGEVRFRRLHDGAEVAVKAGYFAVVAPNAPFITAPFHTDPHAVH